MTLKFEPHTRTDHAQLLEITEDNIEEVAKEFGWSVHYDSRTYGRVSYLLGFSSELITVGNHINVKGRKMQKNDWVKDNG